jgi:hypothetical protein
MNVRTMWGTQSLKQVQKTATEIHYDMQPQINKLNKYADVAEWMEWTITEWCANAIDTTKKKDEQVSLIVYGRRYILEALILSRRSMKMQRQPEKTALCLMESLMNFLL